jgi:hypothetical protein
MAMPRFDGASALTSCAVEQHVARGDVSRPAIRRSSVDLPQPDGPTKTMNSPERMSRSTPLMTSTSAERLADVLEFDMRHGC